MKRLLMLFLMVITAVTGVHAEIMTGKERGINYAYNTDTYTMTFWGVLHILPQRNRHGHGRCDGRSVFDVG